MSSGHELLLSGAAGTIIGTLLGIILGHRMALGRDKRKEFNEAIEPLRAKVIRQLEDLENGSYRDGITNADIVLAKAKLQERDTENIVSAYEDYIRAKRESGRLDGYGSYEFIGNGRNEVKKAVKTLLSTLKMK